LENPEIGAVISRIVSFEGLKNPFFYWQVDQIEKKGPNASVGVRLIVHNEHD
jgi:hypothetical protein